MGGRPANVVIRVDDFGAPATGLAGVSVHVDGVTAGTREVAVGRDTPVRIPIGHGGENVIELEAKPGAAELTLENNRGVVTISGVRDRLGRRRVYGEPQPGERR